MKKIYQLIFVLLLLSVPVVVFGQPSSPQTNPGCFPPPCIPIDGGATLLIVAGLAIGGKKAYDLRNKEK